MASIAPSRIKLTPLDPWIAAKIGQAGGPANRQVLEAYQLGKLRATLALARAQSPFYREHLAGAPDLLASLDDVPRLPFTTAADLRAQPLRLLCVPQGEIERVVTLSSSGTTGPPKRLYFTAADQELTVDFFRAGMSTLVDPGDRVLILLPCTTPGGVGDLLATALERLGVVAVKHGPVRDVAETLAVMARQRVNSLVGIPVQVLALARGRDERGRQVPLSLKSVLLSTDYVSPAIIAAVEQAWGGAVYNHYGMTEMGLGGGVECQARRGYHLREADLYFEIVDPASGQPLPAGEQGEIVFTTLTRTGLPLIRYRTGDLGRFLPAACACGTSLRTLAPVRDRIAGRVALGQGLYLAMPDLDDALFSVEAVLDVAATLTRVGHQDQLNLVVQVSPATHEVARPAVALALDSVVAIRQARAAGLLSVRLDLQDDYGRELGPPGKRLIRA